MFAYLSSNSHVGSTNQKRKTSLLFPFLEVSCSIRTNKTVSRTDYQARTSNTIARCPPHSCTNDGVVLRMTCIDLPLSRRASERRWITKFSRGKTYLGLINMLSEVGLILGLLNEGAEAGDQFFVLDLPVFSLQLKVGIDSKEKSIKEPIKSEYQSYCTDSIARDVQKGPRSFPVRGEILLRVWACRALNNELPSLSSVDPCWVVSSPSTLI